MAFFVQISDVHLVEPSKRLYGTVDSAKLLDDALNIMRAAALRPSAILVTGDVGDYGNEHAYRAARSRIEAFAREADAQVVWLNGNHDEVESFRRHVLDGGPVDRSLTIDGVRLIVLDSTVPGGNHGLLEARQLEWLESELSGGTEPALVLMHHPPLRSPLPGLDRDMLRNRDDLARVLRGSRAALVVTGHTHYAGAGSCGGVPVWVGGATAAYTDVAPPNARARVAGYGSYSRIDVLDGEAIATSIPLLEMETVLDFQAIIDGTIDPGLLAEIGIK